MPPPRRPAFDPNLFVRRQAGGAAALLADTSHPLFDPRLPDGDSARLDVQGAHGRGAVGVGGRRPADEPFVCQGYLHQPDRQRCEIYVRQGIGHGEVTLADALAVSCNVYFFHFAGQMGPRPLVDWAERFGFGRPTGVDLPGEARRHAAHRPKHIRTTGRPLLATADTQSMAIGQGSLTATPLQVLRMMAAVANGGRLVTPHVVDESRGVQEQDGGQRTDERPPTCDRSSHPSYAATRFARVCAAWWPIPKGTAHGTVFIDSLPMAGKTGTAETGEDRASHAWFAGYVPADDPKLAFVVVLEHAGDAATAAGPVAKRLVLRMEQLGLL